MKEIIIVAGPKAAGKTSFANEFLPAETNGLVFINADEIARDLLRAGHSRATVDIAAGREMLNQIDDAVRSSRELMFETTLASLTYARKIPSWKAAGYSVSLLYLRMPSAEASIARVAKRVAAGGHHIPEATIRQRFQRSLEYMDRLYKPIVDEWYIWESMEGEFRFIEAWNDE